MSHGNGIEGGGENSHILLRPPHRSLGPRDEMDLRLRVSPYLVDRSMVSREQLEVVDTFDHEGKGSWNKGYMERLKGSRIIQTSINPKRFGYLTMSALCFVCPLRPLAL